jgi:uncharacterized flavoprotein (TIGR03862 family)
LAATATVAAWLLRASGRQQSADSGRLQATNGAAACEHCAMDSNDSRCGPIAVIGGGPAGLMAAETAIRAGRAVDLYDGLPSVGRKILIAGKGGLNLTHTEPFERFVGRYRERSGQVRRWLQAFDADALRAWAGELGIATMVGSSGRVFPTDLKAAPLLRGWLRRLREQGVRFHTQHRWTGWDDDGALRFRAPAGELRLFPAATILALGGASWPKLGSDGAWVDWLRQRGVDVAELRPANCGFEVDWSAHFRDRFAGQPLKPVALGYDDAVALQGELLVTEHGLEGSLLYALTAPLRQRIDADGVARIRLDLAPGRSLEWLQDALAAPRGKRSHSEFLRRHAGLDGVRLGLLHEVLGRPLPDDPAQLAAAIKALPLRLHATRPIAEAISSAGGVRFEAMDEQLMLRALPGVFCAGEMIDWEAPTGGYLLTACMASGRFAASGALAWLAQRSEAAAR